MAKAKIAEGAPRRVRERSRREEQRERGGPATNLLERQTGGNEVERSFPTQCAGHASEGISHLERLVRERTRELEGVNAALRASESTLRSFYESAPLMMGVVEVSADDSDILHIYDNPATDRFFGWPPGSTDGQSALGM